MSAAVCFSVDDVHPTAGNEQEAAGEARAVLDRIAGLLDRHRRLKVTLFTTPDWRSRGLDPSRGLLQRIPVVRNWTYMTPPLPIGTLRVDRHPSFVRQVSALDRADVALHGLHHVRRGTAAIVEFAGRTRTQCRRMLTRGLQILAAAGLTPVPGVAAPGWLAPPPLLRAMADLDMRFIGSARDLTTPVATDARAFGSGLQGVSLLYPQRLPYGRLVHISTNFQATTSIVRAMSILEHGGLLHIKAHLLKRLGTYEALDGLDRAYAEYIDRLCCGIEDRFGEAVWWTSMAEVATHVVNTSETSAVPA